jgi:hypothetical protein
MRRAQWGDDMVRADFRAAGRAALIFVATSLAACDGGDWYDRIRHSAAKDLTAAGALRDGASTDLRQLPLAVHAGERLCGGPLGNSRFKDGGARDFVRSSKAAFTDRQFILTSAGPGRTIERQFFAASARHDMCYGEGLATYRRTRTECDDDFVADMSRLCETLSDQAELSLSYCRFRVFWAGSAARVFGGLGYGDNSHNNCEYDVGLQPARDSVVAGRFIASSSSEALLTLNAGADGKTITTTLVDVAAQAGSSHKGRLDLSVIELHGADSGLAMKCAGSTCRLGDYVGARDLLAYAPKVIDVTGGGRQHLLLFALHVAARPEDSLGPIAVPLSLEIKGGVLSFTGRAFRLDLGEHDGDSPSSVKRLRRQAEILQHHMLIGRVLRPWLNAAGARCGAGQQVVIPSIRSSDKDDAALFEVRTLPFCLRGGEVVSIDIGKSWKAQGHKLGSPDHDKQYEAYKRFQHPPMLMPAADRDTGGLDVLYFFFRSKCDGQAGCSKRRGSSGEVDLNDMLVQRLLPTGTNGDHAWEVEQQDPRSGRSREAIVLYRGWDRLGFPWVTVRDSGRRVALLTATLSNCQPVKSDVRKTERTEPKPESFPYIDDLDERNLKYVDVVEIEPTGECRKAHANRAERIRVSTVFPNSPMLHQRLTYAFNEWVDLIGTRVWPADPLNPPPHLEPSEASIVASYLVIPPVRMSFGASGDGLLLVRPGRSDCYYDSSAAFPLAAKPAYDAQDPVCVAGRNGPRVSQADELRLLMIAATAPGKLGTWQVEEYVCVMPAGLRTRVLPLAQAPLAVIRSGGNLPDVVTLTFRDESGRVVVEPIRFGSAQIQNAAGLPRPSVAGEACKRDPAARWRTVRPWSEPWGGPAARSAALQ